MSESHLPNIDAALDCKNIFDCNRCAICDKGGGTRMRYRCGHTACTACANSQDCFICFTNQPVIDEVLTTRVEHASDLLNAYQDLFSVDVYKKQRLSEKLKIEKQLFPECIQAPFTYYNKRRSLNRSSLDKENQLHLPGQEISPHKKSKMESKINLVKKWLTDNEYITPRKPFADLNVNQQRVIDSNQVIGRNKLITSSKIKKPVERKLKSKRKTQSKLLNSDLKTYITHKNTGLFGQSDASMKNGDHNNENILKVQFDDEPIVIDDSQVIDKDKEAWIKVLEAHRIEEEEMNVEESKYCQTVTCKEEKKNNFEKLKDCKTITSKEVETVKTPEHSYKFKVPFYKMSRLLESCRFCNQGLTQVCGNDASQNEVSVVVKNSSFITTIRVCKDIQNLSRHLEKHSMEVQTNSFQINSNDNNTDEKEIAVKGSITCAKMDQLMNNILDINTNKAPIFSEDLFSEGRLNNINVNKINENNQNVDTNSIRKERLIIVESDSDESIIQGHPVKVRADVHKSCNEFDYGVLSEVRNEEDHARKARRPARGMTPDSTNSSDKENFHPNKPKRPKMDKKCSYKK